MCRNYLRGRPCYLGDNCRYRHPEGQFGSLAGDRPPPERPGNSSASQYNAGGQTTDGHIPRMCWYGDSCREHKLGRCKFRHSTPGGDENKGKDSTPVTPNGQGNAEEQAQPPQQREASARMILSRSFKTPGMTVNNIKIRIRQRIAIKLF